MNKLTPEQLAAIREQIAYVNRNEITIGTTYATALLNHIKALEEENARYKESLGEILEQIEGDYTQQEIDEIPLLGAICEIINIHLKGDSNQ